MPRHQTARQARRGYTLTELLIVIIIMITIFAIALPIAKKVMDDSNTREASRQLSAIFQLAKSRAAQTGRPFGVWLQCDLPLGVTNTAANPNPLRQVTQLYLAEVPEPFTGAFVDSRVSIGKTATGEPLMTAFPEGPWPLIWGDPGTPPNYFLGNPGGTQTGLMLHSLVGANSPFFIRFNYAGPWFRGFITGDTGPNAYAAMIYGRSGSDGFWGKRDDDNDGQPDHNLVEYLSTGSDDLRPPLPQVGVNGVPFQILREPHRSGNPLEMPNGTCIDLAYSGMGTAGLDFAGDRDPFSITDIPSHYGSIVIMFLPAGAIDSIYLVPSPGVNPASNPIAYGQINATGSLHFLVGKVQKVNPAVDTLANTANFNAPEDSNLADSTSLWLSIGRLNGAVTTSENLPDLGSVSAFTIASLSTYLQTARQAATGHEQMGGR
jgi:type II secretory pathway pseudopilin PulG